MFYRIDYSVQSQDQLQQKLNSMYGYENDLSLQVMHRKRLNLVFRLLQDLTQKNRLDLSGTALDIGCNSGLYSKILSDFGFRKVFGIDISETGIATAKATFSEEIREGKIVFEKRGIESVAGTERFQLILCTEVIEHTDDPMATIRNVHETMSPGSIAVISLPNCISVGYSLEYFKRKLLGKPISRDLSEHLRYPFWKTLRLFKSDQQFRRIKSTGTNLFLFKIILNLLRKTKGFARFVNHTDSFLSTLFPFKYFTQFFFVIIEKRNDQGSLS